MCTYDIRLFIQKNSNSRCMDVTKNKNNEIEIDWWDIPNKYDIKTIKQYVKKNYNLKVKNYIASIV